MLRNVLILSGLIVVAAMFPAVYGVDLHGSRQQQADETTQPAATQPMETPVIARAEAPRNDRGVELAKDSRGHYFGEFRLNGRRVPAMVDTGATVIAINRTTARQIGITLTAADFNREVGTANGRVKAAQVKLDRVEIGRIRVQDVVAVVLPDEALEGTLIGMSFLGQLDKFEVHGDRMVLAD